MEITIEMSDFCRAVRECGENIESLQEQMESIQNEEGQYNPPIHRSLNDYKVTTNAKEQFLEALTKEQKRWYDQAQFIKAIGNNNGKYIIYCKHTSRMNIWDYQNPMRYCISVYGAPLFSIFLSQKLLIETNEEKFLELSNHYKWVERDEDYSTAGWRCIHKGMLGNACDFVLP